MNLSVAVEGSDETVNVASSLKQPSVRLGYLVGRYPAVSHTFVLREVRCLRELGFDIKVASVDLPDRPLDALTAEEREEAGTTFFVKQTNLAGVLSVHLKQFAKRPRAYLHGLFSALRLGGSDIRKAAYAGFYFVEAILVGDWMMRQALSHLHVHFASTVGLIASRVFPISLSMTVHGPDEFYDVQGSYLPEKIARCAFICCIGSFACSQLMKFSAPSEWDKFEIAPLGVDPNLFRPRRRHEISGPFEVLCVGRLVAAKGQHVLVRAIDQLVRQGRDVRLRLVGKGPDMQSLRDETKNRGLEGNIVFEGAVNQDRIRSMYESADVFALASFAEGIPVVLMEAMAMEIPCVTTWITGIPELIRHEVDGLLTPPADPEAFAAAIARLMDDSVLREQLGRNGRVRVMEKYDLANNVRRLAAIFARRLGEPG